MNNIKSLIDVNYSLENLASELKAEGIVEPHEYFKNLKEKFQESDLNELYKSLDYLLTLVKDAKRAGQEKLLSSIKLNSRIILNEIKLHSLGITTYVYRSDLKEFVDKVTPKDSVKIIELSRFPRIIPSEVVDKIEKVKKAELFDKYCVLFTDLTNNTYQTEEERQVVERNRDPIVFGYFEDSKSHEKGERFYAIADWEDEYCDLTIEKLTEKMARDGIGRGVQELGDTAKEIILEVTELLKEHVESKSFWSKFKDWFKGE